MAPAQKTIFVIASLLLLSVPNTVGYETSNYNSNILTSQMENGLWINDTININGSTTLDPTSVDWVLYDVTNPYSEWEILREGHFFTSVTPVSDDLWIWELEIGVDQVNCTCWLEIGQPNGLSKEFMHRIIFIGVGPHNPVLSPLHEASVIVDQPVDISAVGILSSGDIIDSQILATWCYAPQNACIGNSSSAELEISWDNQTGENVANIEINPELFSMTDGAWKFTYTLQGPSLLQSPPIHLRVYVDNTDPVVSLICPEEAMEGEQVLVDGSGSSDGVWGNNLQSIWYVTDPAGYTWVESGDGSSGLLLDFEPDLSGNYTVKLDVIDTVGRMASNSVNISVSNIAPQIQLSMENSLIINPDSWQFTQGEEINLHPNIIETGRDGEVINIEWTVNDEFFSSDTNISISDIGIGIHTVKLVVTDDDGDFAEHEIVLTVNAKAESNAQEVNYAAILILVLVLVITLFSVRSKTASKGEINQVPKWSSKTRAEEKDKSETEKESLLWDEEEFSERNE